METTNIKTFINWAKTKDSFKAFGNVLKDTTYTFDIDLSQGEIISSLISGYDSYLNSFPQTELLNHLHNLTLLESNLDKFLLELFSQVHTAYVQFKQYNYKLFSLEQIKYKVFISQERTQTDTQQLLVSTYVDYDTEYFEDSHPAYNIASNFLQETIINYLRGQTVGLKNYWLTLLSFGKEYQEKEHLNENELDNGYINISRLDGDNMADGWLIHEAEY